MILLQKQPTNELFHLVDENVICKVVQVSNDVCSTTFAVICCLKKSYNIHHGISAGIISKWYSRSDIADAFSTSIPWRVITGTPFLTPDIEELFSCDPEMTSHPSNNKSFLSVIIFTLHWGSLLLKQLIYNGGEEEKKDLKKICIWHGHNSRTPVMVISWFLKMSNDQTISLNYCITQNYCCCQRDSRRFVEFSAKLVAEF